MASNGKRMVSEDLIKKLENLAEGVALEDIVDKNGNPRFIEGSGVLPEIPGITFTYNKWSLSGTHLMFVIAGSIANETVVPPNVDWAKFFLPKWIVDKIYTVWSNRIDRKNIELIASNYVAQTLTVYLGKEGNYIFITAPTITLTAERFFRIQFDLLIDSE